MCSGITHHKETREPLLPHNSLPATVSLLWSSLYSNFSNTFFINAGPTSSFPVPSFLPSDPLKSSCQATTDLLGQNLMKNSLALPLPSVLKQPLVLALVMPYSLVFSPVSLAAPMHLLLFSPSSSCGCFSGFVRLLLKKIILHCMKLSFHWKGAHDCMMS